MNSTPEPRGFQFPGTFEVTAFGPASDDLSLVVLAEVAAVGATPLEASLRTRPSREGRFLAVSVSFLCDTRARYEAVQNRLRAHPKVRWIL
jgi:hypothetical protein